MADERVGNVERISDPQHFDKLFLGLMVRRMQQKRPNLFKEDPMERALAHLDSYVRTGNSMYLIEAGNYLWAEFATPNHQAAHFKPFND